MFITFEGIDHSGKSTQAKMLENFLKKQRVKVILVREPGGTLISEQIREVLLDKANNKMKYLSEFMLFSAARHQLVEEVIRPHLKKGYIVICDRFYDSSTAYQGYGGNLNLKEVAAINKIATGGLVPDFTFLLNLEYKNALDRRERIHKKEDRIEEKKPGYYNAVINGYREIAANEKDRFVVLNGMENVDLIHIKITETLEKKIKKYTNKC